MFFYYFIFFILQLMYALQLLAGVSSLMMSHVKSLGFLSFSACFVHNAYTSPVPCCHSLAGTHEDTLVYLWSSAICFSLSSAVDALCLFAFSFASICVCEKD